jgi:elongation factor Ts
MPLPLDQIRQLREQTGAGVMECRKALEQSSGDLEKAVALLREQGSSVVSAKGQRRAEEGVIMAYVHHGGKLGSLVELNCETDFVARNEEFISLAKELAMQVAATSPKYVSRDDVPAELLEKIRTDFRKQGESLGKPPDDYVKEKIDQFASQICLLEQPYIRDAAVTVDSLLTEKVAKFRERMRVKRFVVFKLGEDEEPVA